MPFRALILDFDGTIRDTEAPRLRGWQELFREHGVELDLSVWRGLLGSRAITEGLLDELESLVRTPIDRAAVAARRLRRLGELVAAEGVRPGIEAHLRDARALGLRTAVASSSSRDRIMPQLRELRHETGWDVLCFGDEVSRSKPDPELYLAALAQLGVAAADGIAYEDSPNGVLSAKRAGLACVAFPNPATRGLDFAEADLVIDSLVVTPLSEVLRRLGRPA